MDFFFFFLNHEADTREAAFVLVLPRPEEGVACSIFCEGTLFGKAYFVESSNIDVQLHAAFEACCLLLSLVFLTAWKRCPLTAAGQLGEG